jgi:glycosyltransferase involved in cell wall biosynthesis
MNPVTENRRGVVSLNNTGRRQMRIAIDGTEALLARQTGTGVYLRHLLHHLLDSELGRDLTVLSMRGVDGDTGFIPEGKLKLLRSPMVRTFWTQVRLPLHLMAHRYDLVHLPDHKLPFRASGSMIATILDLAVFRFPGMFEPMHRRRLEWFTRDAARRARRLLAISESTKSDLTSILGVSPERIDVTPLGADPEIFHPGVEPCMRPVPYVLSVGAIQPRKNFALLIRAFKRACAQWNEPVELLIAGQRGWMWGPIESEAKAPPFADRVHILGYVPDERLPSLYRGAMIFALPSLYEGFGIPLVEAMACGAPVVASNVSSFPEVVGDAGLLLDPTDEGLWAERLLMLFGNADLRTNLGRKSIDRARRFTWENMAQTTIAAYTKVLKEAGRWEEP